MRVRSWRSVMKVLTRSSTALKATNSGTARAGIFQQCGGGTSALKLVIGNLLHGHRTSPSPAVFRLCLSLILLGGLFWGCADNQSYNIKNECPLSVTIVYSYEQRYESDDVGSGGEIIYEYDTFYFSKVLNSGGEAQLDIKSGSDFYILYGGAILEKSVPSIGGVDELVIRESDFF